MITLEEVVKKLNEEGYQIDIKEFEKNGVKEKAIIPG